MRSSTARKVLATLLVLTVMGAVTGSATVAALSGTTENTGNAFAAGSVGISDNDGGSTALYNVSGLEPGQGVEKCIKVAYGGSLSGEVRMTASDIAPGDVMSGVVTVTNMGTGSGTFSLNRQNLTDTLGAGGAPSRIASSSWSAT